MPPRKNLEFVRYHLWAALPFLFLCVDFRINHPISLSPVQQQAETCDECPRKIRESQLSACGDVTYAKQKYSFLQRNRSVVILLQQWNCSRGEHKSSSIYIFNEPQLKVVGWRVRVNVLFSDFYSRHCCCWSKRHFPGTLGLREP